MALARSPSGPGGLSINTSSANSLFGPAATPAPAPAPAAGMFGSTQTSKPLFGASATTTAPATGGLFGATTQPQTGGLFSGAAQPQAASQPGGLFGGTAAQAPAGAQQSSGLFGNTNTSQAATGSMFGNFGATQNQSGGLFGGLNDQSQPKPTGDLFGGLGSTQNQQPRPQTTMFQPFNQCQNQNPSGLPYGGLTMGQANQQQQQPIPGVRIDTSNIRGTTRFSDLQADLQAEIEKFDKIVLQQIEFKSQCDGISAAHVDQLEQIPNDVEFCRRKLIGVQTAMSSDVEAIAHVQGLIKTDADNAKLSFRVIDNLKLPQQYHTNDAWNSKSTNGRSQGNNGGESRDIVGFFAATADELSGTLNKYQKNITEIELHLRSVEAASAQQISALVARRNNGASVVDDDAVRDLAGALTEFEQSILHVAGKVGGTREGVQTLQLGSFTGTSNGQATNAKRGGVY